MCQNVCYNSLIKLVEKRACDRQVETQIRETPDLIQVATIIYSRSPDLAKLNPKCHMNYSIIFTEISFYPETSRFTNALYAV